MATGFQLIHARPNRVWSAGLSWFLFVAVVAGYLYVADVRHRENPEDRVTPTVTQMAAGMYKAVMQPAEEDEQAAASGGWLDTVSRSMLWKDTRATSRRFFYSLVLLIPAVTMRLFSEEKKAGTIEIVATRPVTDLQIILGKYLAALLLVVIALLPTLLYYYTIYQLASPVGNLDVGAIRGSYIGLLLLSAVFVSIGLFASSLTDNQIVAFIIAAFFCFVFYLAFNALSGLGLFGGKGDDIIQQIGIQYHYASISRGVVDSRDVIYFLSLIVIFILSTKAALESRKW
jgi:ABC-2 type transport system permease protein